MSGALIQLLVLAGVALFLILKLRSVLGSREGFEKPAVTDPRRDDAVQRRNFDVIEGGPDRDITDHVAEGSDAARALAAMKLAEPSFSVSQFLQGARGAYEMILTAFDKGDMDRIRPFLGPEVSDSFTQVVAARKERGITLDTNFIGLRELALADARFDRTTSLAEITVRFGSELSSVARDSAGQVVEGNPRETRRQRDVWTFERRMGSNDPNWRLVATGE
jgi:predicted lipid-binding transport protein (Tim44 family)